MFDCRRILFLAWDPFYICKAIPPLSAGRCHRTCVGQSRGIGRLTLDLQRIGRRLALWHVDYAMHIEADFFGAGGPGLVAEAVLVFAVVTGVEAVITGGDGAVVDYVIV